MAIWGVLAPILAGAATGAIDALSGATSAKMSRTAFKSRYQDTVADMRKAGLNPALAYGQGAGSGAQNQQLPELGTSAARGMQATGSAKQAAATADLVGSQAALLKAQSLDLIDQVRIRNELLKEETKLTNARTVTERERPKQIRQAVLEAQIDTQWKSATWDKRMELLDKSLRQAGLQLERSEIENILLNLSKPQAEAEARFYEGAGQYSPYLNSALDILRALMPMGGFLKKPPVINKTFNYPRR